MHSKFKFEVTHGPVMAGGVGGFRLRDRNGKFDLAPVWVSADMKRGEPVVVANGMVFGYGSGEETKQSWPDIGLNFDSSIRAAKSTHATLYVLDAQTGDELYLERRTNHLVQSLLRADRGERARVYRDLRRHAVLLGLEETQRTNSPRRRYRRSGAGHAT